MSLAPIIVASVLGVIALVVAIYFFAARGGRRTQAVFFLIVGLVLLVVAGALGWQNFSQTAPGGQAGGQSRARRRRPQGLFAILVASSIPAQLTVRRNAAGSSRFPASNPI